jgi:hypothetical protein
LLTTVFFAGLETYEGERDPIGVAFLGKSQADFIIQEGSESGGAILYQWKIMQFDSPRPFAIRELVKLAVAGVDRRIYSAVRILEDGTLAITGLAREGANADSDAFIKIIASSPGCLSIVAVGICCLATSAARSSPAARNWSLPPVLSAAHSRPPQAPPVWRAMRFPTTSMPSVQSCARWRHTAGAAS